MNGSRWGRASFSWNDIVVHLSTFDVSWTVLQITGSKAKNNTTCFMTGVWTASVDTHPEKPSKSVFIQSLSFRIMLHNHSMRECFSTLLFVLQFKHSFLNTIEKYTKMTLCASKNCRPFYNRILEEDVASSSVYARSAWNERHDHSFAKNRKRHKLRQQ